MKQPSKHLRLLRFLDKYRVFSIKDVVAVTDSNNPYRTIEHLKEHIQLDHIDVVKDLDPPVRFRLYHLPRERHIAVSLAERKGWRVAA